LDAEGAIWYADVPNRHCVRIREGGEVLQTITADRGCFSCALGGPDGLTLFIMATSGTGLSRWSKANRPGSYSPSTAPPR
jgi:sugar lactone lactonase YvrE